MAEMDLILWRHAEAHETEGGGSDLSRRLTAKGERQAACMASWLHRVLPATTRILVSPAQRTQQTALALGRELQACGAIAPERSGRELLEAVGWPQSEEPVLVVGHQPTLGQVAAHLVGGFQLDEYTPPWRVKKGAVW